MGGFCWLIVSIIDMALSKKIRDKVQDHQGIDLSHLEIILHSFDNSNDQKRFLEAFDFACGNLKGVFRDDGASFLSHMVEVTYILHILKPMYEQATGIKVSVEEYITTMIHDVHEENDNITLKTIAERFGQEVHDRVVAVSTEEKGPDKYSKSFNKLVEYAVYIPTVILIKLADRMHNMETLLGKKPEKRKIIALDTLMHHVPLAKYVGLTKIGNNLRNLVIKYITSDTRLRFIKEHEIYSYLAWKGVKGAKGFLRYKYVTKPSAS